MTFNYKLQNFVSEPTKTDKTLKIYTKTGKLIYSFVPDMAYFFYKNNFVIIKIEDQENIVLDFETVAIATEALKKLNRIKKTINEYNSDSSGGIGSCASCNIEDLANVEIDLNALTNETFLKYDPSLSGWTNYNLDALSSSTYTNGNKTPYAVGGIDAGRSFSGATMQDMWDELLYPTIMPTSSPKSASISGVNTSNVEVGTNFSFSLGYGFNRGSIDSKDSHPNIPLVGPETTHNFSGNGVSGSNVNFNAIDGNMSWSVEVFHSEGTGLYYDSTGTVASNLDSQRVAGSTSASASKRGYYRYFYGSFITNLPSDSTSIRNFSEKPGNPNDTNNYLSENNLLNTHNGTFVWYYDIPPGKKWTGFYFDGGVKSVSLFNMNTSSSIDITSETSVNINDANSIPTLYTLYEIDIGGSSGFTEWQTFRVTINL